MATRDLSKERAQEPFGIDPGSATGFVHKIERELQEARNELARVMNDLLSERQLREVETERADAMQSHLENAIDKAAFFQQQNSNLVTAIQSLISTLEGSIPEAGKAIISTFMTVVSPLRTQANGLAVMVKDSMKAQGEFMRMRELQRKHEKANPPQEDEMTQLLRRALNREEPKPQEPATEQPIRPRSLEKIGEELANITGEIGRPHAAVRQDLQESADRLKTGAPIPAEERSAPVERMMETPSPTMAEQLTGFFRRK